MTRSEINRSIITDMLKAGSAVNAIARALNIFKDLFAGVRNVVGGRSEAVEKTMRDSRRTALYERYAQKLVTALIRRQLEVA
jgi:uncharacterized protein YbjQ (UPF0145 family)